MFSIDSVKTVKLETMYYRIFTEIVCSERGWDAPLDRTGNTYTLVEIHNADMYREIFEKLGKTNSSQMIAKTNKRGLNCIIDYLAMTFDITEKELEEIKREVIKLEVDRRFNGKNIFYAYAQIPNYKVAFCAKYMKSSYSHFGSPAKVFPLYCSDLKTRSKSFEGGANSFHFEDDYNGETNMIGYLAHASDWSLRNIDFTLVNTKGYQVNDVTLDNLSESDVLKDYSEFINFKEIIDDFRIITSTMLNTSGSYLTDFVELMKYTEAQAELNGLSGIMTYGYEKYVSTFAPIHKQKVDNRLILINWMRDNYSKITPDNIDEYGELILFAVDKVPNKHTKKQGLEWISDKERENKYLVRTRMKEFIRAFASYQELSDQMNKFGLSILQFPSDREKNLIIVDESELRELNYTTLNEYLRMFNFTKKELNDRVLDFYDYNIDFTIQEFDSYYSSEIEKYKGMLSSDTMSTLDIKKFKLIPLKKLKEIEISNEAPKELTTLQKRSKILKGLNTNEYNNITVKNKALTNLLQELFSSAHIGDTIENAVIRFLSIENDMVGLFKLYSVSYYLANHDETCKEILESANIPVIQLSDYALRDDTALIEEVIDIYNEMVDMLDAFDMISQEVQNANLTALVYFVLNRYSNLNDDQNFMIYMLKNELELVPFIKLIIEEIKENNNKTDNAWSWLLKDVNLSIVNKEEIPFKSSGIMLCENGDIIEENIKLLNKAIKYLTKNIDRDDLKTIILANKEETENIKKEFKLGYSLSHATVDISRIIKNFKSLLNNIFSSIENNYMENVSLGKLPVKFFELHKYSQKDLNGFIMKPNGEYYHSYNKEKRELKLLHFTGYIITFSFKPDEVRYEEWTIDARWTF